jgi:Icc-related predicted phosphoesterase
MIIVAISDTHGRHEILTGTEMGNLLPDGDLLIHAGDLTNIGGKGEVNDVLDWLISIAPRYKHGVIFIAGNHDRGFDPKFNLAEDKKDKPDYLKHRLADLELSDYGVTYLENNYCIIDNIKIWGSPMTPDFFPDRWAFNRTRGDIINEYWKQIPDDTNIIITHGPPYGYNDYVSRDQSYVGCSDLANRINEIKPFISIHGHIHDSRGYSWNEDTNYINASILDDRYDMRYQPIVFDVDFEQKKFNII